MSLVSAALHAKLAADAGVTALLSTYKAQPAIFTFHPVPEDASLPYLATWGAIADSSFDTKTTTARDVVQDLWIVVDSTGSTAALAALAKAVRASLHRQTLTVDGHAAWELDVSGPVAVDTDRTAYAEVLTVRCRYNEG